MLMRFYHFDCNHFDATVGTPTQLSWVLVNDELDVVSERSIKIHPSLDTISSPQALLSHGIGPNQLSDGVSELEAVIAFLEEGSAIHGLIETGFNSTRFDQHLMRHICFRNFLDPYKWEWVNNHSAWDVKPLIAMAEYELPGCIRVERTEQDASIKDYSLVGLGTANEITFTDAPNGAILNIKIAIELCRRVKEASNSFWELCLARRSKRVLKELIEYSIEHTTPVIWFDHESINEFPYKVILPAGITDESELIALDLSKGGEPLLQGQTITDLIELGAVVRIKLNTSPLIFSPMERVNKTCLENLHNLDSDAVIANLSYLKPLVETYKHPRPATKSVLDSLYSIGALDRDDAMTLQEMILEPLNILASNIEVKWNDIRVRELLIRFIGRNDKSTELLSPAHYEEWQRLLRRTRLETEKLLKAVDISDLNPKDLDLIAEWSESYSSQGQNLSLFNGES